MINFYHRFVPGIATILDPIYTLLLCTRAQAELQWSDASILAFNQAKVALAKATLLSHPVQDAITAIMTDASDIATGAVLQQFYDDRWHPIAYYSHKLSPAERKYSTFDRELLAIYRALKHFRYFVEGRTFSIFTDHNL